MDGLHVDAGKEDGGSTEPTAGSSGWSRGLTVAAGDELPRRSTNVGDAGTTFGNANQEHVQGEDSGKKNGSEERHYPADQSNQADFVQSAATLNEKHKELTNHLMPTESSSNLGLSQFTYGLNLLEQRKRKVGRTHEESTNENNMGNSRLVSSFPQVKVMAEEKDATSVPLSQAVADDLEDPLKSSPPSSNSSTRKDIPFDYRNTLLYISMVNLLMALAFKACCYFLQSWVSKKFMTGCVVLFPVAVTFFVTWWFIQFVDGFFSPLYEQLGFDIFGLGFVTSLLFVFLVGVFVSSWLGATVFWIGEWLIKRMPFVKHIYSASKQISSAISPDQNTTAFKEVAIIRHPRVGEYAFGFITSSVILQCYPVHREGNENLHYTCAKLGRVVKKDDGDEELCSVFVPTNHLYIGDILLVSSKDIIRPNLSIREGIEKMPLELAYLGELMRWALAVELRKSNMEMYSLATRLSTFNNRSAIKVRVIRNYVVREKKGSADLKSQELVLHDPENNQPLKQITELAGKTLLFQITAKSYHTAYRNTPFPVLRINNDPQILKEHCSQLLKLEDNACNSNM
nr:protein LIKE COV 2-like [Ipomoea batatas]